MGSEVSEIFKFKEKGSQKKLQNLPPLNFIQNKSLYRALHKALGEGLIESSHDLSEGGLVVALTESAIGGRLGCILDGIVYSDLEDGIGRFFGEGPGRFVISLSPDKEKSFLNIFKHLSYKKIGKVTASSRIIIQNGSKEVFNQSLEKMTKAFKKGV